MDRVELIKGPIKRMFGVDVRVSDRGIGLEGPEFKLQQVIDIVDDAVDGSFDYARGVLNLKGKLRRNEGETVLYINVEEKHISRLIGRGGSMISSIARSTRSRLWYNNEKKRLEITSKRLKYCTNAEDRVKECIKSIERADERNDRRKSRSPTATDSSTSSSSA